MVCWAHDKYALTINSNDPLISSIPMDCSSTNHESNWAHLFVIVNLASFADMITKSWIHWLPQNVWTKNKMQKKKKNEWKSILWINLFKPFRYSAPNQYHIYLYCWSIWAFSMRLSLARRFWNQILIWVSVNCKRSAISNLRPRDMYSLRWNSTSNRSVCSLLNVVRCRLGLPSFLRRRATKWINGQQKKIEKNSHNSNNNNIFFKFVFK